MPVLRLQGAKGDDGKLMILGRLTSAVEVVSGKTFGPVPMNPMLASDTRKLPELRAKQDALVDALVAWAKGKEAATQVGK